MSGVLLWGAGLVTTVRFIAAAQSLDTAGTPSRLGGLARREARLADIGFALAFVGGLWLLLPAAAYYMKQPWMHLKLTVVAALIAVHAMVRIGAKRVSEGGKAPGAAKVAVVLALFLLVIATVTLRPMGH